MAFQYSAPGERTVLHEVTFSRVFTSPSTNWITILYVVNNSTQIVEAIAEAMAEDDDFSTNFSLKTSGRYFEDSSIRTNLSMGKYVMRGFVLGGTDLFEANTGSDSQSGGLHLYMGRVADEIDGVAFYDAGAFQSPSFYVYKEQYIDDENTLSSSGVGQQESISNNTMERVTPRAFTKKTSDFSSDHAGKYVTFRNATGALAWRIQRTRARGLVLDSAEELHALTMPADIAPQLVIFNTSSDATTQIAGARRIRA